MFKRIKKFFTSYDKFRRNSIRFKMAAIVLAISALTIAAVEIITVRSIKLTVEREIIDRLITDLRYVEELIGENEWYIKDGGLYCGDTLIGDGTEENTCLEPFKIMQDKIGSFSYAFMRCSDEELTYYGDNKNGYMQGHYIRIAGTTLNPDGESIVGTYIDKKVADVIDTEGEYSGIANVDTGKVICYYEAVKDKEGNTVGVLSAGRSVDEVEIRTYNACQAIFWTITVLMALGGIGINIFIFRWLTKLDKANEYLTDISTGEFPAQPLNLDTRDELSLTEKCINEMNTSLKEKSRITGELAAAADIQMHMLPREFPPFPDRDEFEIYASMNPAKEIGGDFYDFFFVDKNTLAVVIADVSGKSMPAALFMTMAKKFIKYYAQMGMEPKNAFTRVNQLLCDDNDTYIFVTAWIGILNLESGELTYVNAGHNQPMVKGPNSEFEYLEQPTGIVLAIDDTMKFGQSRIKLEPGSRLFLYTDGVTEASDEDGRLYGEERLKSYMNAHGDTDAETLLKGLKADIDAFAGEKEQFDDITMLELDFIKNAAIEEGEEKIFTALESNIPDAQDFVVTELGKFSCPENKKQQIIRAVQELFSNISKYAYPNETSIVKIKVSMADGKAQIRFTDYGVPFDTWGKYAKKKDKSGITTIRENVDDYSYKRQDNKNINTLVKSIG